MGLRAESPYPFRRVKAIAAKQARAVAMSSPLRPYPARRRRADAPHDAHQGDRSLLPRPCHAGRVADVRHLVAAAALRSQANVGLPRIAGPQDFAAMARASGVLNGLPKYG